MSTIDIATFALLVAVAIIAVAIIGFLFTTVRNRVLSPAIQHIYDALEPKALEAIHAVEDINSKLIAAGKKKLSGDIKLGLATAYYAKLPDYIMIFGRQFPIGFIKTFVSEKDWTDFVQRLVDRLNAKLDEGEAWATKRLRKLGYDIDAADGKIEYSDPRYPNAQG